MKNTYQIDLDKIEFSESGKKQLIAKIEGRGEKEIKMKKMNRGMIAVVLLVSVTGTLGAATWSAPILENLFLGNYKQVSTVVQQSVVNKEGYTASITDVLGDRTNLYLGIAIEAPQGTILNAESGYHLDFEDAKFKENNDLAMGFICYDVPDLDRTDNKIEFVMNIRGRKDVEGSLVNNELDLTFESLYHFEAGDGQWKEVVDSSSGFKFKDIALNLPTQNIKIDTNTQIQTLGVRANVTSVEISPLGVIIQIEGENLRGHHTFPQTPIAVDGYPASYYEQEVVIGKVDGTEFEITQETKQLGNITLGSGSGSASKGGNLDSTEMPSITVVRQYGEVLDITTFEYIKINGTKIPLK